MALILVFHNDSTGGEHDANYNIQVMVGDGTAARTRTIAGGRIEGHNRPDGWKPLVQKYLDSLPEGVGTTVASKVYVPENQR